MKIKGLASPLPITKENLKEELSLEEISSLEVEEESKRSRLRLGFLSLFYLDLIVIFFLLPIS
jgi:hypothetical protein